MGEKNLWWKVLLIFVLVGMCAWQLYPVDQKLRGGIDLVGGYSLLFEIDESDMGSEERQNLAERVMTVLKQRVDPQGNRNLVWRPIGQNRLEIQMPRPMGDVQGPRDAFEKARTQLAASNITAAQIRAVMNMPLEQQGEAFAGLVRDVSRRQSLFDGLVENQKQYEEIRQQVERPAATDPAVEAEAEADSETPPATQRIDADQYQKLDRLLEERRGLIAQILQTNIAMDRLEDLLALDPKSTLRKEGLEELFEQHPNLASRIETLATAYDAYSKNKGMLDDPSDLMRMLRGAGVLEFRILAMRDSRSPNMLESSQPQYNESVDRYVEQLAKYGPRLQAGDNYQWFRTSDPNDDSWKYPGYIVQEYMGHPYVLAFSNHASDMVLMNDRTWSLKSARPSRDQMGRLAISFALDPRGGNRFGAMTGNNIDRPLCIFLDNQAISAATIRSQIYDRGEITGNFSPDYVNYMVSTLEAGVLPARLREVPLQEKNIGPSLGQTNREKGTRAVMIAFAATVAFMILYYAYCGMIADIALLMNLVLTLGIMSFLQATFTLPGIAGLILTLGMAVDANVLINERIREELGRGISVRMAVKLGYEKAFSAILDSNVTTIMTAVILASLGSEEIKGFGMTLGIGLVTSMFTALFVTRQFFHVMVPTTLKSTETRKAWLTAGIMGLVCGFFLALGALFNAPAERVDSTLWQLGRFLLWLFGTAVVLLVAMWVFRFFYYATGRQKNNRLSMMKLLSKTSVNWMAKYRAFWAVSAVVIVGGIILELRVNYEDYLDIEFIGGTSVQVQLKDTPELREEFRVQADEKLLSDYIGTSPGESNPELATGWLRQAADLLDQAEIKDLGKGRYQIGLPGDLSTSQIRGLLLTPRLEAGIARDGISDMPGGVYVQFGERDPSHAVCNLVEQLARLASEGRIEDARREAQNQKELLGRYPEGQQIQALVQDKKLQGPELAAGLTELGTRLENWPAETVKERIAEAAAMARSAAERLRLARVQMVESDTPDGQPSFEIICTEPNKNLVAEALLASMGNILQVVLPIEANLVKDIDKAADGIFPIRPEDDVLGVVVGSDDEHSVAEFKGGFALVFDDLRPPQSAEDIEKRLRDMRLQPDFEDLAWRQPRVVGLEPVAEASSLGGAMLYKKVAILVKDDQALYVVGEDNDGWRRMAEQELYLAQAALASTRSLERVTQFAPQVAAETAQKAIIGLILALIAIAGYLWMRFGSVQFGVAGIIALYHDVAVTLSAVMVCHHLHDTAVGQALLLQDFKIDLTIIAAMLTIVGFSINDTIVIFDRIRELRGRLATVSPTLINTAINQTLSRTIITSFTTFIVVLLMYIFGGDGVHGFAFAMIMGCLSGVYSTIAIATPMLQHPRAMWITTIFLGSVTAIGIVYTISAQFPTIRTVLIGIVMVLAAIAIIKQVAGMLAEKAGRPAHAA
ncbi:MAG: protein translocase subunit SecD [Phycisphaerales bacterium]|nr:protein translocase subunit SecD [Phycisphaerales bacterium]